MDATVSARIPVEVKKQGDALLREIGSSATELINAAYDYLLKTKSLPQAQPAAPAKVTCKVLRGKDLERFKEMWEKRSIPPIPEYDGTNFKELFNAMRDERYEGID